MNQANQSLRCTFSTWLTISRILITPVIVYAMVTGYWGTAFLLFIGAAITDVLDGYFARILCQETVLGAMLDPLADKILLIACFTTLACTNSLPFSIPHWFVILLLLRELLIVGGFIYLFFKTAKGINIEPTRIGKLTTFANSLFIVWLFSCYFFNWLPIKTYYLTLGITSFLIIFSLIQYSLIALKLYRKKS